MYTALMTSIREQLRWRRFLSGAAVAVAIAAAAFMTPAAQGQEQQPGQPLSASDIADGMRLYQQKGDCQACHGWAGDGHKTDSQMPDGANLRSSSHDAGHGYRHAPGVRWRAACRLDNGP